MKAAVLRELGRAPRFEQFAEPVAGKEEAFVRVRAASLKAIDRQLASGSHFASPRELPVVCGTDGVGELDAGIEGVRGTEESGRDQDGDPSAADHLHDSKEKAAN